MRGDDSRTAAVEINASLVRELIAGQFPQWRDLLVGPVDANGWDNRTFRLGDAMCVRLPSAKRYADQVAKEQQWLPRLAPQLPLPIPEPLAMGAPTDAYPWNWSIYRWIDGEVATMDRIGDPRNFAVDLAGFLAALQRIDPNDGPEAGPHNFFRGGSLAVYDGETREATASLGSRVDAPAVLAVWESALKSTWRGSPVWIHGDIETSNLLVRNGRLAAVIDFGCCGVGDPACDLVVAWTFFTRESREAFRAAISLDDATWMRARGWALWKALIRLAEHIETNPQQACAAQRVIDEVLRDC